MLKRVLIYLLLVALPLQGYAAVNHCPPEQHQHRLAAQPQTGSEPMVSDHQHMGGDHQHARVNADHHASSKIDSGCSASFSCTASILVMVSVVTRESYTDNYMQRLLTTSLDAPIRPPRFSA